MGMLEIEIGACWKAVSLLLSACRAQKRGFVLTTGPDLESLKSVSRFIAKQHLLPHTHPYIHTFTAAAPQRPEFERAYSVMILHWCHRNNDPMKRVERVRSDRILGCANYPHSD